MKGDSQSAAEPGWQFLLLGLWCYACLWLVLQNVDAILTLSLPDPDDNLRLQQVRDWLAGQNWFELHQHRLAPALGADIHWSRIVDLPIAATILTFRPLVGAMSAEIIAATIVPLLTLLAAMALLACIARRLIAPDAWFWAAAMLLVATQARSLMMPLRIDHHGWQLALVLTLLLGLVSTNRRRGGMAAGASMALSMGIGTEMLPYLALGGGLAAVRCALDGREVERLRWLATTLLLGSALVFLLFVPPSQRFAPRCDAFTKTLALPVVVGSTALVGVTLVNAANWRGRLLLAAAASACAALVMLGDFGSCVWDPYYAVDPGARGLWLDQVVEAVPLLRQPTGSVLASLFFPIAGLAGTLTMLFRSRVDAEFCSRWAIVAAFQVGSILLAILQTRAMAAAEAFAVPAVAALCWLGRRWIISTTCSAAVRAVGTAVLFLCLSGLVPKAAWIVSLQRQGSAPSTRASNATCMVSAAIRRLNDLPTGPSLTLIDVAPALLVHTHHNALAGPYHRNGRVIADVMRAWAGSDAEARPILNHYRVRWIFLCDGSAEGDLYAERAADGLYARLERGAVPDWLKARSLPNTPWRAWQVVR